MWSARASSTTTSPPARPTAARKVAATTRSGTTAWRVGRSSSTPSTSRREVPAPRMRRPHRGQQPARSHTSGSRAAFSITVVPLASTAAMRRLSVAVWLGYSSTSRRARRAVPAPARRPGPRRSRGAGREVRAHRRRGRRGGCRSAGCRSRRHRASRPAPRRSGRAAARAPRWRPASLHQLVGARRGAGPRSPARR